MSKKFSSSSVHAVAWQDDHIVLLDQRVLPNKETYIHCHNIDEVIGAIKDMVVRGAPAIGVCAAYAAVLSANSHFGDKDFYHKVQRDLERLSQARPTAVNLMWATNSMSSALLDQTENAFCLEEYLQIAIGIHEADLGNNYRMGQLAADIFKKYSAKAQNFITHCNAGSLATGGYGTALGAIRSAWKEGLVNMVYADETRPWLQGARLTAWELHKDGVPVTLNVDGAAAWVIKNKQVSWVVVGADRVVANGDVANKVGTFGLALIAKQLGAKVMVVAPSSTVDMNTLSGADIDIEERDAGEIKEIYNNSVSPAAVAAFNPVFDVTPADYIDYLVTEKGAIHKPDATKMSELMLGRSGVSA